jgi:hypothetical protein
VHYPLKIAKNRRSHRKHIDINEFIARLTMRHALPDIDILDRYFVLTTGALNSRYAEA